MKKSSAGTKRILVVEDELRIAQVCQRVLIGEGFQVYIAINGNVAQDTLGERDYDLCLIDIWTPSINGMQLYQFIVQKHPALANRVIFTTGDVAGGETQRFLKLTGRPYLPKPFTPDELKAMVGETLRQIEK